MNPNQMYTNQNQGYPNQNPMYPNGGMPYPGYSYGPQVAPLGMTWHTIFCVLLLLGGISVSITGNIILGLLFILLAYFLYQKTKAGYIGFLIYTALSFLGTIFYLIVGLAICFSESFRAAMLEQEELIETLNKGGSMDVNATLIATGIGILIGVVILMVIIFCNLKYYKKRKFLFINGWNGKPNPSAVGYGVNTINPNMNYGQPMNPQVSMNYNQSGIVNQMPMYYNQPQATCPYCGTPRNGADLFCASCGGKF